MARQQAITPLHTVLMVGKSWDLVSASIEALGTRGEITFRGPVDADQADPAASLFLIAPDSAGPLEKPRCEREDGTSVPLLLCVPRQALESEDTFQGVDDFARSLAQQQSSQNASYAWRNVAAR